VCVKQTAAFKLSQKNKLGLFEFSDVNPATHAVQTLPSIKAPVIYDVEYEKRVRIWEPFWDSLFDVLVEDARGIDGSPGGKKTAAMSPASAAASVSGAAESSSATFADLEAIGNGKSSDWTENNVSAIDSAQHNANETRSAFTNIIKMEDPAKLAFVKRWKTIKHKFQCRFEEDEDDSVDLRDDLDALFQQVYCQPSLTFAEAMKVLESSAPPLFALSIYAETKNVFEHFKTQLGCTSSAEACYWFCFWSDFWFKNSELDILKDKHHLFSVTEPGSLCFNVMVRNELETTLMKCALWNEKGSDKRPHLFFPELFDRLYTEMGRADVVKGMTADLKTFMFQAPWQVKMPAASGKNKTKKKGNRPESRKPPKTLRIPKPAATTAGVITDAATISVPNAVQAAEMTQAQKAVSAAEAETAKQAAARQAAETTQAQKAASAAEAESAKQAAARQAAETTKAQNAASAAEAEAAKQAAAAASAAESGAALQAAATANTPQPAQPPPKRSFSLFGGRGKTKGKVGSKAEAEPVLGSPQTPVHSPGGDTLPPQPNSSSVTVVVPASSKLGISYSFTSSGIKLEAVDPSSPMAAAGLNDDTIITSINSTATAGINQGMLSSIVQASSRPDGSKVMQITVLGLVTAMQPRPALRRRGSTAHIEFHDRAMLAFQRFDLNGNGTLSEKEVAEMLSSLEENVDRAMVETTIARYNSDGQDMHFEDFVEVWRAIGVTA
jgi:flagellar biosynthesis GTPase FlhF